MYLSKHVFLNPSCKDFHSTGAHSYPNTYLNTNSLILTAKDEEKLLAENETENL